MKIRKSLCYPPYIDLTLIKIVSTDYNLAYKESVKIKEYLDKYNIKVLGPSSNINKINNKYYIHLILKYKKLESIYKYITYIVDKYKLNKKINVEIDINPKKI